MKKGDLAGSMFKLKDTFKTAMKILVLMVIMTSHNVYVMKKPYRERKIIMPKGENILN